jgi:hypothetical protein
MINFKKTKKVLILVLVIPALSMVALAFVNILNRPNIKTLDLIEVTNITSLRNIKSSTKSENIATSSSFDYALIGYRSGAKESSVIVKKGNKEYVVAMGEKLVGLYELIEVNQSEIIFRHNEKLYKIENLVGK